MTKHYQTLGFKFGVAMASQGYPSNLFCQGLCWISLKVTEDSNLMLDFKILRLVLLTFRNTEVRCPSPFLNVQIFRGCFSVNALENDHNLRTCLKI